MKNLLAKNSTLFTNNDKFFIFILLIISLLTILPIYLLGIPDCYDVKQHIQFAQTYQESILQGNLFPNISSAGNYGFGDIGVRFYPPQDITY